MIIYTYQCLTCSQEFDIEQHLTDDKKIEYFCDKCNSLQPVERIIKNRTFILNDSQGWGKTGYSKNVDMVGNLM